MLLRIGSTGQLVSDVQQSLNLLPPTRLASLVVDGIFGPLTRNRVMEFQGNNQLTPDGIVGPVTTQFIDELLDRLGLTKTSTDVTVTPITQSILGMAPVNGLIKQFVPAIPLIITASFRAGDLTNTPTFTHAPLKTARLGIFAAQKIGGPERTVILLLPESAAPKRVIIGVSHQFGQTSEHYKALGWSDPRSPALINYVLLKHVLNRWGAEVLTAPQPTALFHIVRAGDGAHELGSFANDGPFVREVLEQMVTLTGNAFSLQEVQAFTFSNGIFDFNTFLSAIAGSLNVTRVINIDPRFAIAAKRPGSGIILRQYLSGETYQPRSPRPGFEYMPLERWKNEAFFHLVTRQNQFEFLHNHAMPLYVLSLGLRT